MRHRLVPLVSLVLNVLLVLVACSTHSPTDPMDVHVDDGAATEVALEEDGTSAAPDVAAPVDLTLAIDLLNAQRIQSDLSVLVVDPALSAGCAAHAAYMVAEGVLVREELPSNPAYTEAGALAGRNGVLAGGMEAPEDAVNGWIASVYHRLLVLDPGVTRVGFAFADGYACLDVFTGYTGSADTDYSPIYWPGRGQTGVALEFLPIQGLSPLPFDQEGATGPVISLSFSPLHLLGTDFVARVKPLGESEALDSLIRLPLDENDPYAEYQRNAVIVVPLKPLVPGTTYEVVMEGTVDDAFSSRDWTFTTAGDEADTASIEPVVPTEP